MHSSCGDNIRHINRSTVLVRNIFRRSPLTNWCALCGAHGVWMRITRYYEHMKSNWFDELQVENNFVAHQRQVNTTDASKVNIFLNFWLRKITFHNTWYNTSSRRTLFKLVGTIDTLRFQWDGTWNGEMVTSVNHCMLDIWNCFLNWNVWVMKSSHPLIFWKMHKVTNAAKTILMFFFNTDTLMGWGPPRLQSFGANDMDFRMCNLPINHQFKIVMKLIANKYVIISGLYFFCSPSRSLNRSAAPYSDTPIANRKECPQLIGHYLCSICNLLIKLIYRIWLRICWTVWPI